MKWSEGKVMQLKDLATSGVSNADIAKQLGIKVTDVYAKRSQLGITIDKVKTAKSTTVDPEFKALMPTPKASSQHDQEINTTRELIRLLEPVIVKADPTIKELEVVDNGRLVSIHYKNGTRKYAKIAGDSDIAILADVTHKCLF
jgi:hypothetical protein